MAKDPTYLLSKKKRGEPIVMLTCYDFPTAKLEDRAGVDVILVGDSVGTNILGYDSVKQVSMEDMIHHVSAVKRGVKDAFLLADMPYGSYENPAAGLRNAQRFMQCGADGVKLEGAGAVCETVRRVRRAGIHVCGHLGFTPQTKGPRPKVAGKSVEEAGALLSDAQSLSEAGVCMLVLELVPEEVSQAAAKRLSPPVIGIGAGRNLDGEVQVVNDILGITERVFRHTKPFVNLKGEIAEGLESYAKAVKARNFPGEWNVSHASEEVNNRIRAGTL